MAVRMRFSYKPAAQARAVPWLRCGLVSLLLADAVQVRLRADVDFPVGDRGRSAEVEQFTLAEDVAADDLELAPRLHHHGLAVVAQEQHLAADEQRRRQ